MSDGEGFTVDFIARGDTPEQWRMVLVEEGPWRHVDDELHRVQGRLYSCIDAAIDGQLAEQFPESNGKDVYIELDCYNVPKSEVRDFFQSFADGVFDLPDYKSALAQSPFVRTIGFRLNFPEMSN